jgi:mannose-6-phosphate isomerase-like protein (cupin superfamily)
MKRSTTTCLFLALSGILLSAQTGSDTTLPGFFQLRSDQLRLFQHSLQPKMNQYKQAADELGDYGNHTAWVAHREADGQAEIHENWADLMFVISGEATLLVGGNIVERKATSPGEVRGPAITNGRKRLMREGDVVQVPAGMPHQFLVTKGKEITFFTMKIAK